MSWCLPGSTCQIDTRWTRNEQLYSFKQVLKYLSSADSCDLYSVIDDLGFHQNMASGIVRRNKKFIVNQAYNKILLLVYLLLTYEVYQQLPARLKGNLKTPNPNVRRYLFRRNISSTSIQ